VPDWARPKGNPNKRFRQGKGGGAGGPQRGGGGGKRERLQKVMAQSGHGSRRNIEILIAQGHITINGQVAKLGDSVGPGDKVKLDDKLIRLRFGEPMPRVLLYHKPEGEIVTRDDPEGRATVFDKLPRVQGGRWVSVGRLDLNTGGLLIFTTNGELANRLTHPRVEVEREYAVRTLGELSEEQKAKLLSGVDLEGESCKFDSIEDRGGEGANHWYHVVLREGKNREVRKMMEAVGLTVSRLMRVRFGSVLMPSFLKRGMMREMVEEDVQQLLAFAGMGANDEPEGREPSAHDEEEEGDNVGNIGHPPLHFDRDAEDFDDIDDNVGNRISDVPPPREIEGNRPGAHALPARRPEGGHKPPRFGKKRGQGHGGQGQPQGQKKGGHNRHQGQGNAQGNVQRNTQGGAQGNVDGNVQVNPQGQGQGHGHAHAEGQPQPQGPGQGKPGRNRRQKNRNRHRGAREGQGEAQPPSNANRDPY
jgi:23S rRNA pseudouridine2605 synthase